MTCFYQLFVWRKDIYVKEIVEVFQLGMLNKQKNLYLCIDSSESSVMTLIGGFYNIILD